MNNTQRGDDSEATVATPVNRVWTIDEMQCEIFQYLHLKDLISLRRLNKHSLALLTVEITTSDGRVHLFFGFRGLKQIIVRDLLCNDQCNFDKLLCYYFSNMNLENEDIFYEYYNSKMIDNNINECKSNDSEPNTNETGGYHTKLGKLKEKKGAILNGKIALIQSILHGGCKIQKQIKDNKVVQDIAMYLDNILLGYMFGIQIYTDILIQLHGYKCIWTQIEEFERSTKTDSNLYNTRNKLLHLLIDSRINSIMYVQSNYEMKQHKKPKYGYRGYFSILKLIGNDQLDPLIKRSIANYDSGNQYNSLDGYALLCINDGQLLNSIPLQQIFSCMNFMSFLQVIFFPNFIQNIHTNLKMKYFIDATGIKTKLTPKKRISWLKSLLCSSELCIWIRMGLDVFVEEIIKGNLKCKKWYNKVLGSISDMYKNQKEFEKEWELNKWNDIKNNINLKNKLYNEYCWITQLLFGFGTIVYIDVDTGEYDNKICKIKNGSNKSISVGDSTIDIVIQNDTECTEWIDILTSDMDPDQIIQSLHKPSFEQKLAEPMLQFEEHSNVRNLWRNVYTNQTCDT